MRSDAAHRGTLAQCLTPVLGPGVGPRLVTAQRAERHDGGQERRRHQAAPDLLAEHGELHHAQPQAALVLGELDRQPPLLRHGGPHGVVVALRRVRRGVARDGTRPGSVPTIAPGPDPGPEGIGPGLPVEEGRRGIAQRLLVG